MNPLAELEPSLVWRHFATLLRIPRPSKLEAALRAHLKQWADNRGLATVVDDAGNLLIRKPATPGMEDRPTVVLQAHLDMVCQKNSGTAHDFERDAIRAELRDGWLIAPETTLGADNGIGVALALALLESDDTPHPALEVLLTVDEEAGMGGARGLADGLLQGTLMINLDTEDWGEFFLGCAGGADVNVSFDFVTETLPTDMAPYTLAISGLRGGHSGVDIHLGRGNAIKLLIRLLHALSKRFGGDLRWCDFEGGSARNALPREATAGIALPPALEKEAAALVGAYQQTLRDELAGVDDQVCVRFERRQAGSPQAIAIADHARLLAALHAAPHGVHRMSQRVAGVVETSNNLGIVRLADGRCEANLMVRSLLESGTESLAGQITSLFELAGATVSIEGQYPGWAPNPESRLLALFQQVYQREYDAGPAAVKVIHAGLECGIIKARYPQLDIVSFGPDIRGAHAPGERVRVESVAQCWHLLRAVIAAIPVARF